MRKLTLFIPGLFGPKNAKPTAIAAAIPALEKLLKFATITDSTTPNFINTLFRIFGFPPTQEDHPVAVITRLIDDEYDLDGIWMRADPVSLHTEREAVILVDNAAFELNRQEALVLAADVQPIFTDRGIELQTPTNHRWYIKLKELPGIRTTPIHEAVGQDIHKNLCIGKNKILWDRLANDVQMSLHNCPLNHERQQRDELAVNGLWMWGVGKLPKDVAKPAWSHIFSDEVTTHGLAKLTGVPHQSLPDSIAAVIKQTAEQDNTLVVISSGLRHQQYCDLKRWQDFIAELENRWFSDVENLLKQKKLRELKLLTETHELTLTRASFMKFWRQHKSLPSYTQSPTR